VGGGAQILELLVGEDINGDKVDLGVSVLASLKIRASAAAVTNRTLEVDISTTLQGRPLIITKPPLRRDEHWTCQFQG
jgi:hypothetical protein